MAFRRMDKRALWTRWRPLAVPSLFFLGVLYYEELFLKLYCFGVISCGLPLFKGDGSGRTGRQAVSQSVTVVIPDQSGDDPGRKERGVQ